MIDSPGTKFPFGVDVHSYRLIENWGIGHFHNIRTTWHTHWEWSIISEYWLKSISMCKLNISRQIKKNIYLRNARYSPPSIRIYVCNFQSGFNLAQTSGACTLPSILNNSLLVSPSLLWTLTKNVKQINLKKNVPSTAVNFMTKGCQNIRSIIIRHYTAMPSHAGSKFSIINSKFNLELE